MLRRSFEGVMSFFGARSTSASSPQPAIQQDRPASCIPVVTVATPESRNSTPIPQIHLERSYVHELFIAFQTKNIRFCLKNWKGSASEKIPSILLEQIPEIIKRIDILVQSKLIKADTLYLFSIQPAVDLYSMGLTTKAPTKKDTTLSFKINSEEADEIICISARSEPDKETELCKLIQSDQDDDPQAELVYEAYDNPNTNPVKIPRHYVVIQDDSLDLKKLVEESASIGTAKKQIFTSYIEAKNFAGKSGLLLIVDGEKIANEETALKKMRAAIDNKTGEIYVDGLLYTPIGNNRGYHCQELSPQVPELEEEPLRKKQRIGSPPANS